MIDKRDVVLERRHCWGPDENGEWNDDDVQTFYRWGNFGLSMIRCTIISWARPNAIEFAVIRYEGDRYRVIYETELIPNPDEMVVRFYEDEDANAFIQRARECFS